MEEIGKIYRDDRDIYLVLEKDGEAYHFGPGSFHQGLTRHADKGYNKVRTIEELMARLGKVE